jgi:hypothetical protein
VTLTLFGVLTIAISLWLMLRGTSLQQFSFVIYSSLLGGSSAINLPALGGSSIRPFLLAFLMLFLRLALTRIGGLSALLRGFRNNIALVAFCAYGILGAMILPHVFAGRVELVPMRPINLRNDLTDRYPLSFSSQNITAAFYFVGTLLSVAVGDILARREGAPRTLVNVFVATSWLHIGFGVLGVLLKLTHHEQLLGFFRNAGYAQLDHEYQGYVRITGIMPETSVYAAYGFQALVVTAELWLRGVRPAATGAVSLAMALILLLSTSSSAYVGLAGYAALLILRWMIFPQALGTRKAAILAACTVGGIAAVLALAVALPHVTVQLQGMLEHMTVDKANSKSAYERGVWARQGFDAFRASHGLGVGPGSFRSSSSLTAIIGAMGVIGMVTYLGYLLQILKPWRDSTFRPGGTERQAVGAAVGWSLIAGMIPGLVGAPSPDPGVLFGVMAAMSLVWRDVRERASAPRYAPVLPDRPVASAARKIV